MTTQLIQLAQPCSRGHTGFRYASSRECVECSRLRGIIYSAKNKEHLDGVRKQWRENNKDYLNNWYKKWHAKNPVRKLFYHARANAKKMGLPFDLAITDIMIPDMCPVLGIELHRGTRGRCANSPSLDRVIPNLGYTKANVVVVSWKANRIKNDASLSDLRKVADFYAKFLS